MAAQTEQYFLRDVALAGATPRAHVFAGTALCDWLNDMREEVDPANPNGFHPHAAVLSFTGDNFTPCMKKADGTPLEGAELVSKYLQDAMEAVRIFTAAKVDVYVASAPLSQGQSKLYTGLTPLYATFKSLPQRFPGNPYVHYLDAATPLQWKGKFTFTLPCEKGEVCTGRWPDGTPTVVVRQADGTHFCPVAETVHQDGSRTCPTDMPGGERFAAVLASPATAQGRPNPGGT
jgi:hypothetical protein